MNINEVLSILKIKNVPLYLYSVNYLGSGECICIIFKSGKWVTGFSEKGGISTPIYHTTETEACLKFLHDIENIYFEYTNNKIKLI